MLERKLPTYPNYFPEVKTWALIISLVLHPLLMATYGCLLLFFVIKGTIYDYMTPFENKWRISSIIFAFTFVFPAINIFVLYKLKRIPSITLSKQSDRTYPYIMTTLFYFGLYYLLIDTNMWSVIKMFIACGGLAILLTALINLKFKISAHMVGIGGLLGGLIAVSHLAQFDMTIFYIIIIICAGLIAMARLILQEHQPYQLYLGFLLGIIVQSGLFFILQKTTFV